MNLLFSPDPARSWIIVRQLSDVDLGPFFDLSDLRV